MDANATAMTDIHDIKPALAVGPDLQWLWWLLGIVLLLALAFLAWRLWRRRKKAPEEKPAPPPLPPEVEALGALDALAADGRMAAKEYYFRLSAVLRRYIERRYGFPAQEMTSEELLPELGRLELDSGLRQEVSTFCSLSDLIKFAGAPAGQSRMQADLALARRFVEQTAPKEEETDLEQNEQQA
ncbi:MAG: DUF4381 family protein [Desulfosarcinaceae bacterium]